MTYVVESPTLNENTAILAQQAGETVDEIVRDVLATTASIYSCSNGSNGSTPTELTEEDIDIVVENLSNNSAKMFTPIVPGMNKVNTSPVAESFWALGHTKLQRDLKKVANYVHVANYANPSAAIPGEWGSTGNVRWVLSPLGSITSGSPDVYNSFIVGQDSYATSELSELNLKNIFKPAGHGDDALNQRSTQGWKTMFGSRILNDLWLTKVRSSNN